LIVVVVAPGDKQDVAVRQVTGGGPRGLWLTTEGVDAHNACTLRGGVDRQARRQALDVARESIAIGGKQADWLYSAWILPHPLLERLQPAFGRLTGDDIGFFRDRGIDTREYVVHRLHVDEGKAAENRQRKRTGYHECPAKRR